MTKPDLVGSPVAATTTLESISTPKISRKMAIVAALVAIAAIALVYAEVKYRFVSTIVSFVVANPYIMGVIALVVVIGYLLYRNGKQTPNDSQTRDLQNDVTSNGIDRALDAEVDEWIDERIRRWRLNTETAMRDDVQRMAPVSERELLETAGSDLMLVNRFRDDFYDRGNYRATLNGARRMLNLVLQSDEELVAQTQDAARRQDYLDRHARKLREGPLSLRWLMNPRILNQNNNT